MFSKRRDYYALLLYRLSGPRRSEMEPFGWQLCKGHSSRVVEQWLKSDTFPAELSSSVVLNRLFARTIGTEDPKLLQTIIDPAEPRVHAIELHISWPDGAGPPSSVPLGQLQEHRQQVQQRIRA